MAREVSKRLVGAIEALHHTHTAAKKLEKGEEAEMGWAEVAENLDWVNSQIVEAANQAAPHP